MTLIIQMTLLRAGPQICYKQEKFWQHTRIGNLLFPLKKTKKQKQKQNKTKKNKRKKKQ